MSENESPAAEVVETPVVQAEPVQEPDAQEPEVKDPEVQEPRAEDPPDRDPDPEDAPEDEPPSEEPPLVEPPPGEDPDSGPGEMISADELLPQVEATHDATTDIIRLRAIIEAIVYLTDEPLSIEALAGALRQEPEIVARLLADLTAEYEKPEHGVAIREVAGGFAMATKPEHHEEVRAFVKNMQAPVKLSLPSLETLAVIAYRQPITAPEVMEIRGVQGAGVLKTLLDRKLIAAAGRKNVVGKPILYKTTKEFLVQFGLKDLSELPSLKEFEDIRRMSIGDEAPAVQTEFEVQPLAEAAPEGAEEVTEIPEPLPEATPANGN
jgi:segregation and condensation protein B